MTTGLLIFAATYLLIAVQRLPFVHLTRPAASLVGAVAMVVFGVLPLPEAYAAVDFDVLVFLLGMMLIVGYLEVGKFFEWAARWVLRRVGTPELGGGRRDGHPIELDLQRPCRDPVAPHRFPAPSRRVALAGGGGEVPPSVAPPAHRLPVAAYYG